jgi:hypothetical protein
LVSPIQELKKKIARKSQRKRGMESSDERRKPTNAKKKKTSCELLSPFPHSPLPLSAQITTFHHEHTCTPPASFYLPRRPAPLPGCSIAPSHRSSQSPLPSGTPLLLLLERKKNFNTTKIAIETIPLKKCRIYFECMS